MRNNKAINLKNLSDMFYKFYYPITALIINLNFRIQSFNYNL